MKDYRNEMREIEREGRWTFFKFLPLLVLSLAILFAIGFGLNSLGLFGKTVVERKVFENSYQRSEALKSQLAVDNAALTEIESRLANPNLDTDTRYNLEAQARATRIRIATTKEKMK